uniref:Chromosome partitioning protein ParB n=1 Tax=uncultured Bacillota bacterium TaxID=344338 RepID=A0A650F4V4_9FIRM|nr:chromosome partitioning protein ParB [uncultured Firmicutes bacterium]
MAEKKKPRKGLGKGLDALFSAAPEPIQEETPKSEISKATKMPSASAEPIGEAVRELKMIDIEPNPEQPRKQFEPEKLEGLADSIKKHGLVQPLLVKEQGNGRYLIIAGERRWRAAKLAGLKKVPCIIKDYSEQEVMEIALIENLQREDLNPIEEAEGYQELMKKFGLTQEVVSERVGKSRSAVANALRLNNLTEQVKEMLIDGRLSQGHARALLPLPSEGLQQEIAERIVKENLNVRQTETLVAKLKEQKSDKPPKETDKEILQYYTAAEEKLSSRLGAKVKIHEGRKKSKIEIEYYTHDDLERLMRELCQDSTKTYII